MLWDKHLFIRNMTEPLKGSAACVCPHVPEVCVCASTAQTAQRVAQKEACSRPGRMHATNSRWGCGDNSHSTVFDMTKNTHRREEQMPTVRTRRTALLYLHRFPPRLYFDSLYRKWPAVSHLEGLAFASHPYDHWYQDSKYNKLKESASLCQMCPLRSLSLGVC